MAWKQPLQGMAFTYEEFMALREDIRAHEYKRISEKIERYKSDLEAAENALHSEIRRFVAASEEIDRLNLEIGKWKNSTPKP